MQSNLDSFTQVYGNFLVNRIGLRYINLLNQDSTNQKSIKALVGLLNNDLTHLISNKSWPYPKQTTYQIGIEGNDSDEMVIRVLFYHSPQPTIILDFDSFSNYAPPKEINLAEIIKKIESYHSSNYDVFRWSIKENKFTIFNPTSS